MPQSLFGLEAELAVSATRCDQPLAIERVVEGLANSARRSLIYVHGAGSRLYLANGGLFYIDSGQHPEVATPECSTPWEAVAHLRAAERMMSALAQETRATLGVDQVRVYRTNVDYLQGTSWGCHESYLGRRHINAYASWLLPHLVSRIIYTGSGGLDPCTPGIRLSLSPRAAFFENTLSSDSCARRGIFHTRDEPLCRDYHRIHVLAGDNTCSQRATWLKMGSTELVVALADANPLQEPWLKMRDPLGAFKGFARDPDFRTEVEIRRRSPVLMNAAEIQRYLLARIEHNTTRCKFPEWANAVCAAWRDALNLIDTGAMLHSHAFDWPIKHAVMRREITRAGFDDAALAGWNDALEMLVPVQQPGVHPGMQIDQARLDQWMGYGYLGRQALARFKDTLAARGLGLDGLEAFNALRRRLCEIDVRFGELGQGIFDTLDRQGVLPDHRVVTQAQIAQAADHPPPNTRAALRGRWVRRLAARKGEFICNWSSITGERVVLNLSDPFATTVKWARARRGRPVNTEPSTLTDQLDMLSELDIFHRPTPPPAASE